MSIIHDSWLELELEKPLLAMREHSAQSIEAGKLLVGKLAERSCELSANIKPEHDLQSSPTIFLPIIFLPLRVLLRWRGLCSLPD